MRGPLGLLEKRRLGHAHAAKAGAKEIERGLAQALKEAYAWARLLRSNLLTAPMWAGPRPQGARHSLERGRGPDPQNPAKVRNEDCATKCSPKKIFLSLIDHGPAKDEK